MYSDQLSIEQAEALLPQVRPLLEEARRYKREVELTAAHYNYDTNLMEEEMPHLNKLCGRLQDIINQLEDMGCYVKDLDIGLINFLSNFEGRDVFLCWKLGESNIKYWHELDENFSHRQEIMDLRQLTLEFETPIVENEN